MKKYLTFVAFTLAMVLGFSTTSTITMEEKPFPSKPTLLSIPQAQLGVMVRHGCSLLDVIALHQTCKTLYNTIREKEFLSMAFPRVKFFPLYIHCAASFKANIVGF